MYSVYFVVSEHSLIDRIRSVIDFPRFDLQYFGTEYHSALALRLAIVAKPQIIVLDSDAPFISVSKFVSMLRENDVNCVLILLEGSDARHEPCPGIAAIRLDRSDLSPQRVQDAFRHAIAMADFRSAIRLTVSSPHQMPDDLLAYLAKVCPGLPLHSVQAEQRLARKAQEEAVRYLDVLTPEAQAAREKLEKARTFLAGYPKLTDRLSTAAKAKRVNEHTNPAHKWVALAIVLAGLIAAVYGVIAWRRQEGFGMYFTLLGLAVVVLLSGTQVIPTMKNNKRAVTAAWEQAQKDMAGVLPEHFPLPARSAHPVVLDRMIRVLREGRAQSAEEALTVVKADLKALNADVQVSQEEYDEVVAIKPMFLVSNYE